VQKLAVAVMTAAATLGGCATLPSLRLARQLPLSESADPIRFEGPAGTWSDARAAEGSRLIVEAGTDSLLDDYLGMSARLIGEPLIVGNRVDLLVDGPETYAAMFQALRAARRTIELQSFIFDDVEQGGRRLTDLLAEKMAEGVSIRVLVDGVGSRGAGEILEKLSSVGVRTCVFNPVGRWLLSPTRLNHRDHRKIVVVDGDDAFAGGINFSRVYRSGSSRFSGRKRRTLDEGWRDTHVRIRGPGARRLRELFEASWAKQGCAGATTEDLAIDAPLVEVPTAGGTVVQIVPSSPDSEQNLTYLSVLGAVAFARESIAVTMAYFVPDERLESALMAAARRGVSVRLILPAFSDFKGVFHAGRSHYARLLEAGVRIYEQRSAFLHAKTVVVDRVWSTVGSTNWDWRSFVHNDEVSVVIIDAGFAARMNALFDADLTHSSEIDLDRWNRRSRWERFLEGFWSGFERLL
jgi:cardiolipin synthase